MRATLPLALALALALTGPLADAAISVWQNDAGTGGDSGNWADHAAPLRNRHGGSAGVYGAELYRYADEVDWYSFDLTGRAVSELDVPVTVQADPTVPCATAAVDTIVRVQLLAPDLTVAASVDLAPCYDTGALHVDLPAAGLWRLGVTYEHPAGVPVKDGPNGQTDLAPPTSTFVHERYAFGVVCDTVC